MDLLEKIIVGLYTGLAVYGLILFFKDSDKLLKRSKDIDHLIKNDPTSQKLDEEILDLNKRAADRLKGDKDARYILKKHGIEIDGSDTEYQFDKNEFLNDFKEFLKNYSASDDIQSYLSIYLPEEFPDIEKEKLFSLCDEWTDILNNKRIYFSEKKKFRLIDRLIANDPIIKKLDKKMAAINKKYENDRDPEFYALLKKYIPKESKKEVQNDINKVKTEIYNSVKKTLKNF